MIRVYEYGCLAPTAGEIEAIEQMRRRNRLWNSLVEIEQKHRQAVAALLSEPDEQQEIEETRERLTALREQIKLERKTARRKTPVREELQQQITTLKQGLHLQVTTAKAARKARVAERKKLLDETERLRRQAVKDATGKADLYWCNYDSVLASYNTARKKPAGIRFHGFRGEGKVSIRYQTGLEAPLAFAEDTRLQIRSLTDDELAATGRKNPAAKHLVSLRVGSQDRAPLWFTLPAVLHREIPPSSQIRSADIVRRVVGAKAVYRLILTVETREQPALRTGDSACAIDVGWRVTPNGLRVAYWYGTDGRHSELLLDKSILFEFKRVRELQSLIDQKFEIIKLYVSERKTDWRLSGELIAELANVKQWRSPGRLVHWLRRARNEDLADTELSEWLKKQLHLYEWRSNLQDQVGKRRRYIYRDFAAKMAKQYSTLIIEDFDLRDVAKRPAPESDKKATYAGEQRFIAAVSELKQALENVCQREGAAIVKRPSPGTTQRCHVCGSEKKWDAALSVIHQCEDCYAVWDQDHNAAINLLKDFEDSRH